MQVPDLSASNGPFRGVIESIEEEQFDKPVVTFTNGLKFSLNATNTQALIVAFGTDESKYWIGKTIEPYAGEAKFQGKMVPSVLVRRVKGVDKVKPPKRVNAGEGEDDFGAGGGDFGAHDEQPYDEEGNPIR